MTTGSYGVLAALAAGGIALLCACGKPAPETDEAPAEREGREETRAIRNTEAIGYSGDAIADEVDAALEASEQRKRQLDAAIDGETAEE